MVRGRAQRIEALVVKPANTVAVLRRLVGEMQIYDRDIASEGVLRVAWSLFLSHRWSFWWD